MADREDRMGYYNVLVSRNEITQQQQQHVKIRRRDVLIFNVTVSVKFLTDYFSDPRVLRESTFSYSSIPINCENFFEDNHDFLRGSLSNPSSVPYFNPQVLDEISQETIPQVQQLLEFQSFTSDNESADSESQEFPLSLDIFVDVLEDEVIEDDIVEETQQEVTTMIPASNEAIQSLKTFTESHFLKTEECSICMDKFHAEEADEDVKLSSSMPCGHVFHHQCIVQWLQTSHTCPLCRYSMPKDIIPMLSL